MLELELSLSTNHISSLRNNSWFMIVSSCVVNISCVLSSLWASINSFKKCSVNFGCKLLSSSSTTYTVSASLLINISTRSNNRFVPSDSSLKLKSKNDLSCFNTSVVISGSPELSILILKKPSVILKVSFNSCRFDICIFFFKVSKTSLRISCGIISLISLSEIFLVLILVIPVSNVLIRLLISSKDSSL